MAETENERWMEQCIELRRQLAAANAARDYAKIERDALYTQLSAWHEAFGTTQLTHALAERDALRSDLRDRALGNGLAEAKENA